MQDPGHPEPGSNGTKPDLSRSRFFCNNARKGSLVCGILAFAALVIGGGFAEISSDGAPTTLETAAVRWVILGSLLAGVILYLIGGRILRSNSRG
jgi:asparagine N-glycosylation enzyme membrane subunit Stt3